MDVREEAVRAPPAGQCLVQVDKVEEGRQQGPPRTLVYPRGVTRKDSDETVGTGVIPPGHPDRVGTESM